MRVPQALESVVKPETRLRARLVQAVRELGHTCYPIENLVTVGMPDVVILQRTNGRGLWVELKYLPRIPVRKSTPLLVGHKVSAEQNAFLVQENVRHGGAFVVASDGSRWFLCGGSGLKSVNDLVLEQWVEFQQVGQVAAFLVGAWPGVQERC